MGEKRRPPQEAVVFLTDGSEWRGNGTMKLATSSMTLWDAGTAQPSPPPAARHLSFLAAAWRRGSEALGHAATPSGAKWATLLKLAASRRSLDQSRVCLNRY